MKEKLIFWSHRISYILRYVSDCLTVFNRCYNNIPRWNPPGVQNVEPETRGSDTEDHKTVEVSEDGPVNSSTG